jgi:hypothetical protein
MANIQIDYKSGEVEEYLNSLKDKLSNSGWTATLKIGADAAYNAIVGYHKAFGSSGGWENRSGPTWGPGRQSTGFAEKVVEGWQTPVVEGDDIEISNTFPPLAHKIEGGTITSSGRPLTIPVSPKAHGLRVAEYEASHGKVFRPKGKDYLAQVNDNTFEVIYVLKNSVTQSPVDGALPEDNIFMDPAEEAIINHLDLE